jgi:hypothetical protein
VIWCINSCLLFSLDASTVARRVDELKNKLRDELREELRGISGEGAGAPRTSRKSVPTATNAKARADDPTDYFELVYECVHTRPNFLNIISLNSRTSVEPDIDLAILQALLNGKINYFVLF